MSMERLQGPNSRPTAPSAGMRHGYSRYVNQDGQCFSRYYSPCCYQSMLQCRLFLKRRTSLLLLLLLLFILFCPVLAYCYCCLYSW
jgi:hypothetical protein